MEGLACPWGGVESCEDHHAVVVVVYDVDVVVVVESVGAVAAETLSCQERVVANVHEHMVGRTGES